MSKPLRCSEVAPLFGVGPKTIVRWCAEGKLPYSLTFGGQYRFDADVIRAIAESRSFPADEQASA